MRDHQRRPVSGVSECQESLLVLAVVWVVVRIGQWILKNRSGLLERDPMLLEVRRSLVWVPLEKHFPKVALTPLRGALRRAAQQAAAADTKGRGPIAAWYSLAAGSEAQPLAVSGPLAQLSR